MLVQLYRDNFVGTPKEELDYEVYSGYFADDFNSNVFSVNNLLANETTIDFTSVATAFGGTISGTDVKSGIIYGFFRAKQTGTYTFFTRSRDASYLRINNVNVVYNNGIHEPQSVYGVYDCVAGKYYQFVIYYGNSGAGEAEFSAGYYEPDYGIVIPEKPLNSNNTTLTGVKYEGEYILTSSTVPPVGREPFKAFNKSYYGDDRFDSEGGIYNRFISGLGGYYSLSGTASTNIVGGGVYSGSWLQIELPTQIRIKHFKINRRSLVNPASLLDLFVFLGTNDPNAGWFKLYERTTPSSSYWNINNLHEVKSFNVETNENEYKYYRIAVFRNQQNSGYSLAQLLLYTEPPPENTDLYTTNGTGLTSYYDVNPETQDVLTTADYPLVIEDDTLQGLFRISILALYNNRSNFSTSKHELLYLASDDLFNNFNGTYKNYIQIHEKPVDNDTERKRFTQFSDDMSFECELNGRIEVKFRRGTFEPTNWRYAMLILDVERIPSGNQGSRIPSF